MGLKGNYFIFKVLLALILFASINGIGQFISFYEYFPGGNSPVLASTEQSIDELENIYKYNREILAGLRSRSIQPNHLIQGMYDNAEQYYEKLQEAIERDDTQDVERYYAIADYLSEEVSFLLENFRAEIQASIIYYLLLLLPFCFFLERLLFAFEDRRKQTTARLGMFIIFVGFMYFSHPAFHENLEPFKLVIGLIGIDLALTAISPAVTLWFNKFTVEVREKFKHERRHQVDVSRSTALVMAFLLGVSNMRKRKVRTLLTCVTLILLTFTVLAFVSVQSNLELRRLPVEEEARYQGVLVRDSEFTSLDPVLYDMVIDYLGDSKYVSPRANLYDPDSDINTSLNGNRRSIEGLVGLGHNEDLFTGMTDSIVAGRWFDRDESGVVLLPDSYLSDMNIAADNALDMTVNINNTQYKVIGVFDSNVYGDIVDLDGHELVPRTVISRTDEMGMPIYSEVTVSSSDIVIMPYNDVLEEGGNYYSFAVRANNRNPITIRNDLLLKIQKDMYVGSGGEADGYNLVSLLAVQGMDNIIMPIIIVGLIVLNTMLGSVYERHREIGIYSAVGLSPLHIGGFFFSEACVYALLGSVSGFFIGLVGTQLVVYLNILPGLTLNYSSFATLYTMGAVMGVVLISSIYPAVMASRIAVPKIERRWKLPPMTGDHSKLSLPFVFSLNEALGGLVYLKNVFDGAKEKTYQFGSTIESHISTVPMENGEGYELEMKVHLAPYDLGINQIVWVRMVPQLGGHVFDLHVELLKLTGDTPSWNRSNKPFLTELRKQCLVWRTMSQQVKEDYTRKGQRLFDAESVEMTVDEDVDNLVEVKCPRCGEEFSMSKDFLENKNMR